MLLLNTSGGYVRPLRIFCQLALAGFLSAEAHADGTTTTNPGFIAGSTVGAAAVADWIPKTGDVAKGPDSRPSRPPTGSSIEATVVAPAAVNQLNGAIQAASANPLDASARANLSQAGNNAMIANRLVDKAAASGKYDTRDYEKVKAALARSVVPPSSATGSAAPSAERAGLSLGAPPSQSISTPRLAERSLRVAQPGSRNVDAPRDQGGTSPMQRFAPVSGTQVALRFENPSVASSIAAEFVSNAIETAVPLLSLGGPNQGPTEPAGRFVVAVLESIRRSDGPTGSGALASAPGGPAETASKHRLSPKDEKAASSGEHGSTAEGGASSLDDLEHRELTSEEKKALQEIIQKRLEATASFATPQALEKEALEDAEFFSAVKNASRDSAILAKLASEVTDSVAGYAASDSQLRRVLQRRAERRQIERTIASWGSDGSLGPVRSGMSGSFFSSWAEDTVSFRLLIVMALVVLIALLFRNARTARK